MKEIITGAIENTLETVHDSQAQSDRAEALASGAVELQGVAASTNRLHQALYITAIMTFWIELCFLLLLVLNFNSQTLLLMMAFNAVMLPATFIAGLLHKGGLYRNYSGLGVEYDFKHWSKSNYAILLDKNGINGVLMLPWSDVQHVEQVTDVSVKLSSVRRGPLSFIPKPALTLSFASPEDTATFLKYAQDSKK